MAKHRPSLNKAVGARTATGGRSRTRVSMPPGPGRPTAARVEAINRAILVAGRAELVNSGFEAARMEAIAAAAGVSKGTLYGRYPTKEALLLGVISDRVTAWSDNWEPDGGSIPTGLRQRLKYRARKLMEYNCSGRLEELERLFSGIPASQELRRLRHEIAHRRIVQVIAQDLIDGTEDRLIEPRTGVRVAEMLIATLYGWWRMQHEVRRVALEEAIAYADFAVDTLLDGRSAWSRPR